MHPRIRSWKTRLRGIYRATKQHATNLAKFVALYKTFLLIQKKANNGKERNSDTFIAGLLGGYLIFGDRNAVNEQVRNQLAPRYSFAFNSCSSFFSSCNARLYYMLCPVLSPPSFHGLVALIPPRRRHHRADLIPNPSHPTPDTSLCLLRFHGVQSCGSSATVARPSNPECSIP